MSALQEAAARLVADRQRQGFPEQVTDPAALGFLASVAFEQPFTKKVSAASASAPTPAKEGTLNARHLADTA